MATDRSQQTWTVYLDYRHGTTETVQLTGELEPAIHYKGLTLTLQGVNREQGRASYREQ